MTDIGKRDIDVLRERVGNGLSPLKSRPAILPTVHADDENVKMAQSDVFSTGEQSSDLEPPADEESGSEYGDIVVPAKRKRRTNNSFALDLNDDDSEVVLPPPVKRVQFNPIGKENSVLIGVWKDSPPADPAKKHAVYAFIDSADRCRQKIWPETRDGEILQEGYPSGTGRPFITPEHVALDHHLTLLSRPELKEYVRIRMSRNPNESPEEQRDAEIQAIEEAKKAVSTNISQPHLPAPSTPISMKPAKPPTHKTPDGKIPNGVFLGFWKNSDATEDAGKHTTFGVVDSNRLRVKIIKFARNGQPYDGNFPTNHGSNWIPFDDVVLEPALQKLLRLQVIEYVKLRQMEQEEPDYNPFEVDENAIRMAIENFDVVAKAQGFSAARLDAQHESSRKAHNLNRAAHKASPKTAKGWAYESPYARAMSKNSHAKDPVAIVEARAKRADSRTSKVNENDMTTPETSEDSGAKESPALASSPKIDLLVDKSNASATTTNATMPDVSEGKAKAIKSKRADANAIAEKLRRVREAAAKVKERDKASNGTKDVVIPKDLQQGRDGDEASKALKGRTADAPQEELAKVTDLANSLKSAERTGLVEQVTQYSLRKDRGAAKHNDLPRQDESMTSRQRAIKETEARAVETRAKEARDRESKEREAAEARAELEKARAERDRAKAAAVKSQRDRETKEHKAVEIGNELQNVRVEMERAKAAAIESVSDEFFDNLDSVEDDTHHMVEIIPSPISPIIRSRPAAEVKIHNDVKYVRQDKGPFAGKLVGEKKEFLTIDGENYVECRILMRAEF